MGSCVSTVDRSGKERSDAIGEEDSEGFKRECKILLLGECFTGPLCIFLVGRKSFPLSSPLFFCTIACSLLLWRCLFGEDVDGHPSLCAGG